MRTFLVVNKESGERLTVEGVEALSKIVGESVNKIPKIRLWKYTIGSFVICEKA